MNKEELVKMFLEEWDAFSKEMWKSIPGDSDTDNLGVFTFHRFVSWLKNKYPSNKDK